MIFECNVIKIGNVRMSLWLPEEWIIEVEENATILAYHEFEDVGNFRITLINFDNNENYLLYEFPLEHVQDDTIDFEKYLAYHNTSLDPEPDSEGDTRIMGWWFFRIPNLPELAVVSSNMKKYMYEEEEYNAFYLQHAIIELLEFELIET